MSCLRMYWGVALGLSVLLGGCSRDQWGLPRTPVQAVSPDGRFVAFVRNHPNLDPPSQSIWLGATGSKTIKLQTLGPDSDWCNTIVWSADGWTVAFLVQDARLITVDARSARVVAEQWLTDWQGEYPPARMVRELSLSPDGREVRFRDCRRHMTRPGYDHESSDCGDLRTVVVRTGPAAPPPGGERR